jgi:hypothetical protein
VAVVTKEAISSLYFYFDDFLHRHSRAGGNPEKENEEAVLRLYPRKQT